MATIRRRFDYNGKLLEKIKFRVGTIEAIEEIEEPANPVRITVNFGDYKSEFTQEALRRERNLGTVIGKRALFAVHLGADNAVSKVLGGSPIE